MSVRLNLLSGKLECTGQLVKCTQSKKTETSLYSMTLNFILIFKHDL